MRKFVLYSFFRYLQNQNEWLCTWSKFCFCSSIFVPHVCYSHPYPSNYLDFIQSSDNYATKFEKYSIKFFKGLWQNDFIWRLFFIPKGLFIQIYAQLCMHTKKIQINTRTVHAVSSFFFYFQLLFIHKDVIF